VHLMNVKTIRMGTVDIEITRKKEQTMNIGKNNGF